MGFLDKLSNAWYIFKTSLSFIKKDKSLLSIPIILILSSIFFFILFILILFKPIISTIFIFNFIIFLFLMYIWTTFLGSAQAWMVHEVALGKDTTLASGIKRAFKNIPDILLFALATLIISIIVGSLRKRGTLGNLAGDFISLVTGIAGKLVLPAMIITERNFIESIKQLGQAIKAIPEIAVFEIGIRPLTTLLIFISIGLSFLFGISLSPIIGIILFLILFLIIIIFSILINQIYYTLLYLTLIEKKKVPGLKLKR